MKERFEGDNRALLIDELKKQRFVLQNEAIANALADAGELVEFPAGHQFIVQDASDNELYLLIVGEVDIIVNGSLRRTRQAGDHVGEMAAVNTSLRRSATVVAKETVVALRVPSLAFRAIGQRFGQIYLPIVQELARRLYQRNADVFVPNETPKVFIMSSRESVETAYAIQKGLGTSAFTVVWDNGVFFAGGYLLENLEEQVRESDFAIAIAEADDVVISRGKEQPTMRDNVLFELGLFMGQLSRHRAILVHPRIADLKIPSDLQGLILIPYDAGDKSTLPNRMKAVCEELLKVIKREGVHTFSPTRTS